MAEYRKTRNGIYRNTAVLPRPQDVDKAEKKHLKAVAEAEAGARKKCPCGRPALHKPIVMRDSLGARLPLVPVCSIACGERERHRLIKEAQLGQNVPSKD